MRLWKLHPKYLERQGRLVKKSVMKYFAALRSFVRLPQTQVLHYLLYYLRAVQKR